MAKITRRQVARFVSILYLALLTALAAYSLHRSNNLSLPISSTLTSFTLALPLLSGLSLETSNALATAMHTSPKYARRHARNIPAVLLPSTLTVLALLVYTTVIATLAGTHISPITGLNCALRERWEGMFRAKQGAPLERIQEALVCCGFASNRDMPYPFPSAGLGIGVDECTRRWPERHGRSCVAGLMEEERGVAGMIMGVAIGTFVWMAVIIALPAIHPTWARESMRLRPRDNSITDGRADAQAAIEDYANPDESRVIEYTPYTDNPGETEQDRQDRLREIAALNNDSRLALKVERARDHPGQLMRENGRNEWSDGE